jgi:hydroxyacylglutathione hydrolase
MEEKMAQEIITIPSKSPFGSVNCYLVRAETGYFLIDTGWPAQRSVLEQELRRLGCRPGNLVLILATHGDFDHTGNCAYLHEKYRTPVAMHRLDSAIVDQGDMFTNRKINNLPRGILRFGAFFLGLSKFDHFKPEIYLEDGQDLDEYGLEAKVLHVPGHSKGSIAFLAPFSSPSGALGQALFCGDLLVNSSKPAKNSLVDDAAALDVSVERVKQLKPVTVYPGHGKPFPIEQLT